MQFQSCRFEVTLMELLTPIGLESEEESGLEIQIQEALGHSHGKHGQAWNHPVNMGKQIIQ